MGIFSERPLYLCVGVRDDMATFLPAVLRGGIDIVQLREKTLDHEARRSMAAIMAPICQSYGVPFIMNDFPELAHEVGADGVHVGQDDVTVQVCRDLLGADAIVGLSTHEPSEFESAITQAVTYVSAGPIVATPTKIGRVGTGVDFAVDCQQRSPVPVYVTGGVSDHTISDLVHRGLTHFVVVRHLTEAADPYDAARRLRTAYDEARLTMPVEPAQ